MKPPGEIGLKDSGLFSFGGECLRTAVSHPADSGLFSLVYFGKAVDGLTE